MKTPVVAKNQGQPETNQLPFVHKIVESTAKTSRKGLLSSLGFVELYSAQPIERIKLIRDGVPATSPGNPLIELKLKLRCRLHCQIILKVTTCLYTT